MATGWAIGVLGVDSRRGLGTSYHRIQNGSGAAKHPIKWVPGALSPGGGEVKRPGNEADHSPPSRPEVKKCVELYFHSPIRFHGVMLS